MKKNRKMVAMLIVIIVLVTIIVTAVAVRNNKKDVKGTSSDINEDEKTEMIPLPEPENNPTEKTEINSLEK